MHKPGAYRVDKDGERRPDLKDPAMKARHKKAEAEAKRKASEEKKGGTV
jgi:hypothetical protein